MDATLELFRIDGLLRVVHSGSHDIARLKNGPALDEYDLVLDLSESSEPNGKSGTLLGPRNARQRKLEQTMVPGVKSIKEGERLIAYWLSVDAEVI